MIETSIPLDGGVHLQSCKRGDPRYVDIRNRHYVPNNGACGRQLHYLIWHDYKIVGIISGGSSAWAVENRDAFFGFDMWKTADNLSYGSERLEGDISSREWVLPLIINNTVFRLENHEKNLATRVLARWRRRTKEDWAERYNSLVIGFETFVEEEDYRKGALYKADNWTLVGTTAGSAKKRSGGGIVVGKSRREETTSKLVYCKRDDDFLDDIETYAEVLLLTWFEVQLYMAMDESGRRWVPPFTR